MNGELASAEGLEDSLSEVVKRDGETCAMEDCFHTSFSTTSTHARSSSTSKRSMSSACGIREALGRTSSLSGEESLEGSANLAVAELNYFSALHVHSQPRPAH